MVAIIASKPLKGRVRTGQYVTTPRSKCYICEVYDAAFLLIHLQRF